MRKYHAPFWRAVRVVTSSLTFLAYGTPSTNVEAQCLRRCAAKYNLGRNLWKKERKKVKSPQLPPTPQPVQPLANGEITQQEWLKRFGNKQKQKL